MPTSRAADKTDRQVSDSEDETFHDLLNLRDQNKVIHEYKLKKPQPTIEELATKYKVSTKHISYIIKNQQAILKSEKSNDVEETIDESARLLLRTAQIKFLDMVMYEYLQRALYYSINIDEEIFKSKAEEVVECMALRNFKDEINFIDNFKSLYGIRHITRQSLLEDIELKEEKPESLDPGDMVRYVQRHKAQYISAQKKSDRSKADMKVYRNSRNSASSRSQNSQSPTVYYESGEGTNQHGWEDKNDSEDSNDSDDRNDRKIIKIEFSPTRISEDTIPQIKSPTIEEKPKIIPKLVPDDGMHTLQNTNEIEGTVPSDEEEFQAIEKPDGNCADSKVTLAPIKTEREDNLSIKIEVLSTNYEPMETYEIREPPTSPLHGIDIKPDPLLVDPEIQQAPAELLTADANIAQDNPRKRPASTVPLREIDTLDEALRSLRALENYALLKENLRAIGLLTQLEDALKKPIKQ